MITLKHLTVERFRLLREINLHFPQRGSILIEGPNEAGKTALLESIYFALYGEALTPLVSNHHKRTLDDLVLYGASQAKVSLTLSIGASELSITRSIERQAGGAGGAEQQVSVEVSRAGMPAGEPITHLTAANEYIITELGHIDGETLRNSCFIEQKGLNRLEELPGHEREVTIRRLLGLEKLLSLTEQFKLTPDDEGKLLESIQRLKLAEIQARIPELSQQLGEVETALDAVTVSEDLAESSQQEADIAEQHLSLEQLHTKRTGLKARLGRIQHLQKADTILGEIIVAYDAIAEARRELPELDRQIAELDRSEREELPALEKRVNDLVDLTRTFGTLERMSNDLLTIVSTIKRLEQERKQYQELQGDNDELDEQIIRARLPVDQAREALHELEERRRTGRPQLEARLQRLQKLRERLADLHQAEEAYIQRVNHPEVFVENSAQLNKIKHALQETEQQLAQLKTEADQAEQEADGLEKRWRELSLARQLEEWQRLKELSQDQAEAEQQVMAAYQKQERLTFAAVEARQASNKWLIIVIGAAALGVIVGIAALFSAPLAGPGGQVILSLLALVSLAVAGWGWFKYTRVHQDAQQAHQRMQEAISQVGKVVAAREAVIHSGSYLFSRQGLPVSQTGFREGLAQVEQEIRALGGTVHRSSEEAENLLRSIEVGTPGSHIVQQDIGETLAAIQQLLAEQRDAARAAGSRVNPAMETVAALRQEQQRLEEQRKKEGLEIPVSNDADAWDRVTTRDRPSSSGGKEGWDDFEAILRKERIAIEDRQHEIATSAGEEGLPIPTFFVTYPPDRVPLRLPLPDDNRLPLPDDTAREQDVESNPLSPVMPSRYASLEIALADTIRGTEQEIASLDGKFDDAGELASQLKNYQDVLDILLARKREMTERHERFRFENPDHQLDRAREQQHALRTALQSLQDSLRQRVKPLGVTFGQTAVSNAEAAARKQLETLHFTLGARVELQSRHAGFAAALKDRQDSLSDQYNQLAKLSASLGSWIVPPNPFAETLAALRTRCQQEVTDANQSRILHELEQLPLQENASQAKIALCQQEIENVQERIAGMLVQHNRPSAKGYSAADIIAVWPLVGNYTPHDRSRLTQERASLGQELQQLEQQELALSTQLQAGSQKLDIEQARLCQEQQEHSYQTKKYGSLLLSAVIERLPRKILPRTEYYLQHILPILTSGRYHEVRLYLNGPFQLRVWDQAASAYISTSTLSASAADQLSLALRLAFAIATLPRDLAAAPGFLILDEPLSYFDRARTQALVDVITGPTLSQHFEQILLVSNSSALDPAMFPYHLCLDGGLIVSSNLPVLPPPQQVEADGYSRDNSDDEGEHTEHRVPVVPVISSGPVTPLPASIAVES